MYSHFSTLQSVWLLFFYSHCAARMPGSVPAPSYDFVNVLFTYAMYFFFLRGQKEKYQKERSRRPELPLPCQPKGLLNGYKLDGAV